MNILVLNGSPRPRGNTKMMIAAFQEGAVSSGHEVKVVDVCSKKIGGCLACEYCHTKGAGVCVQKDDMQEIYWLLQEADMLAHYSLSREIFWVISDWRTWGYLRPAERRTVLLQN